VFAVVAVVFLVVVVAVVVDEPGAAFCFVFLLDGVGEHAFHVMWTPT
jgi:hypothetical protein